MKWQLNETSISLPYTSDNLKILLSVVYHQKNNFSHYEFAKWCDNLTMILDDEDNDDDLSEQDQIAFHVARDIECNWDLNLYEMYSEKELKTVDLSRFRLPEKWILDWCKEMNVQ